jgi:hypothetical protein
VSQPAPATAPGREGWHADPWRRHQVRFFDGSQWTEHVADGGLAGLDSTPVADLPRSHPRPPREAPPDDPTGPRVLDEAPTPGVPATDPLDVPLLLLELRPGADGSRRLALPDDTRVGSVAARRPGLLTRLGRALVSNPTGRITEVSVLDAAATEVLRLSRPTARIDPVVDVRRGGAVVGTVHGQAIVQGLRAQVLDAGGGEVGVLTEAGAGTTSLVVTDPAGTVLARTTPVWDVPGTRHHLPPGVVLVDRRPPDAGGPGADPAVLLGALLSPVLLRPPG